MSYTVTIATTATRDLVVEALRSAADQRTRVARQAARTVADAKAAGTDVRSRSVKVTGILAEAGELAALADEVEALPDLVIVSTTPAVVEVTEGGITTTVAAPAVDDGTSPAAQALAELAGLQPYDPDAPEDPLSGATPEDEPTDVAEVLT